MPHRILSAPVGELQPGFLSPSCLVSLVRKAPYSQLFPFHLDDSGPSLPEDSLAAGRALF